MRSLVFLMLFLPLVAYSAPEIKGSPDELKSYIYPDERTLSISDKAEETAYSDEAIVNLVVTTEDKQLSTALKLNTDLRGKVKSILVAKGVREVDIKNSKFSSSPQYGWFGRKPDSYKVMNRMAIRISSERHMQDIAEISDQYTEINLSGTTFKHSEKSAFEQLVKKKALAKVMEKKAFYETSLGIKLVPVSFVESDVGLHATHGAGLFEEEVVVTSIRLSDGGSYSKTKSQPRPKNSFDEVKYQAAVTVEFRVE